MKTNQLFIAFIVLSVIQLGVSAKMVYDREQIFVQGDYYKFVCAPVDPHDPLRGKYINLNFQMNSIGINTPTDWDYNQTAFLRVEKDARGYASVLEASPTPFPDGIFQVEVKVTRVDTSTYTLYFDYPFTRYYMSEDKAQAAEELYRASTDKSNTYALVRIPMGREPVLEAVMIDDKRIEELLDMPKK